MHKETLKKSPFVFHMAYFSHASDDSSDFSRGMLKRNTKPTTHSLTH